MPCLVSAAVLGCSSLFGTNSLFGARCNAWLWLFVWSKMQCLVAALCLEQDPMLGCCS